MWDVGGKPGRSLTLLAATGLATLLVAAPALAGADQATPAFQVPDHPLPTGCGVTDTTVGTNFPNAEVEPLIDVDRSSAKQNVVAVFQQDRWSNGGSHGLITSVSHEGGADGTWHTLGVGSPAAPGVVPTFDRCTGGSAANGGDFERSSDPWVSFAPNGDAYQIAISFDVSGGGFGGNNGVLVSKSPASSHGEVWQKPITLRFDTATTTLNDKESITADPNNADNVYAVWDRLVSPAVNAASRAGVRSRSFHGPAWFSRTTTAGASWDTARIIFDPGTRDQTIGNQIVVTPSHPSLSSVAGDLLVDGFDLIINRGSAIIRGNQLQVAVLRSLNQGGSWSGPIIVDRLVDAPVTLIEPDGSVQDVRTGDILPEFGVDRASGTLYAAWQDGRFTTSGRAQVAFSQSQDGGLTWSPTIRINAPGSFGNQVFTPQIHVADDGTIGVVYYQFDNDLRGQTTVHVVHCHAATQDCTSAASWNANGDASIPGSSFFMDTAPNAGGFFIGDYVGLTDFGLHGFRPFVVLAQNAATAGPTDVFSDTVCPTGGC